MSAEDQRPLALVADNDRDAQEAAVHSFARIGFRTSATSDGPEALALFRAQRPDFVLIAAAMPDSAASTLCREIRALPEGRLLPIVILGDIESDAQMEEAYACGATDFMPRPCNWNHALRRFSSLLRMAQAEEELTQANARLFNAIDFFPGAFTMFDAGGRLILANRNFRRSVSGIRLGMTIEEVGEASLDANDIDKGGLSRGEWIARQMDYMRSSGWWEVHFRDGRCARQICKRLPDGGSIVLSVNITAEKRRQAALLASMREAEAANHLKAQFLSGMSHEIRTPLNAIIGFSDIIRKEMIGAIENRSYVEYAADINRSGNSLLDTLTLILDISKIEAGRQPIQEDEFEVNRMLSAACRKYCLAANEKGVTLAIDDSAMLSVTGDATRLGRALACLLDNAIRFSPPGGIVRLSAAETDDGIALSVIDEGLGMDEGELAQALCPLRPMEEETRKRAVGLGLAYAKTLARAHGGRLVIETARGEGTAASIILPQARAVARAGETPSSFAPGA